MDHNSVPMTYKEIEEFVRTTIQEGDCHSKDGIEAQVRKITEKWDDDKDVALQDQFIAGYQI